MHPTPEDARPVRKDGLGTWSAYPWPGVQVCSQADEGLEPATDAACVSLTYPFIPSAIQNQRLLFAGIEECGGDSPDSGVRWTLLALPPATVWPEFFHCFQNSFYTSAVSRAVCCRAGDRAVDKWVVALAPGEKTITTQTSPVLSLFALQ